MPDEFSVSETVWLMPTQATHDSLAAEVAKPPAQEHVKDGAALRVELCAPGSRGPQQMHEEMAARPAAKALSSRCMERMAAGKAQDVSWTGVAHGVSAPHPSR